MSIEGDVRVIDQDVQLAIRELLDLVFGCFDAVFIADIELDGTEAFFAKTVQDACPSCCGNDVEAFAIMLASGNVNLEHHERTYFEKLESRKLHKPLNLNSVARA